MARPSLNPLVLRAANFRVQDLPKDVRHRVIVFTSEDDAPSRGVLYWKDGSQPKVGVHLMHPRTDQTQNYNIVPLVQAGYVVLGRAGRWANNDVETVHETLMLDMAAGIRFLREEIGCDRVILVGNSGGGTLAAMYQAQASIEPPGRLTDTAAGDPLDLNAFDLPPADGLAIIGGHLGEGQVLLRGIDPSVIDESDPASVDPELDLYDPAHGFREPPASSSYSEAFLEGYRVAQLARVRRLDAHARASVRRERDAALAAQALESTDPDAARRLWRQAGHAEHMVIYRTSADPAAVDLGIEPDDRFVGSYFSRRPDRENYGGPGFARYLTPRAWLSTWSATATRADTRACLANVHVPFILVHYSGDAGLRLSEAQSILDASASEDKEMVVVRHADHYGRVILDDSTVGGQTTEGTAAIVDWATLRFAP
ncbi:MAG: hypothetical protein QOH68_871 [Nocardioidaceae bacterium]|nr:hypothetical protein [Nocardioidaceae bacterium]